MGLDTLKQENKPLENGGRLDLSKTILSMLSESTAMAKELSGARIDLAKSMYLLRPELAACFVDSSQKSRHVIPGTP